MATKTQSLDLTIRNAKGVKGEVQAFVAGLEIKMNIPSPVLC